VLKKLLYVSKTDLLPALLFSQSPSGKKFISYNRSLSISDLFI